jgi:RNA polymerase-binding transcription factor DksA
MTLRHIGKERDEVERNTEWMSKAAYEKRARLLARLRRWYVGKITQIDQVLTRPKKNNYGLCLICDELIEAPALDTAPESALCAKCKSRTDYQAEL